MDKQKFSYESMGTTWKISLNEEISQDKFENIKEKIISASKEFDQTYSRFIESSLVTQLSNQTGERKVPKDLVNMLRIYFDLYPLTDKKLNPLIGETISDLGYDAKYTLTPKENIRKTPGLEILEILDDTHINLKDKVLIDLGALGKGYFVDKIAEILEKEGINHYLVDGSGDIRYKGEEMLRVGLEDPRDEKKVVGRIEMKSGAMASSGTNRRKWGKYNHVIDPHTNTSVEKIIATWVITPKCAIADALASAFFFVEPERIADTYVCEYAIMRQDGMIKKSAGFTADFF